MAADLDDWEEYYGHDLETLEPKSLFRYRASDATELAFANVTSLTGVPSKEVIDVRLRSVKSERVTIINFRNASDVRVRAIWLDFNGHEIAYSIIEPGQNKRYRTYASHPWIVRNCKTSARMVINQNEVIFGGNEPVDAIIRHPPVLQWTKERHSFFSLTFRARVRCLLLCHKRLEKNVQCTEHGIKRSRESAFENLPNADSNLTPASFRAASATVPNLGDIPSLLLLKVVHYMSLETPVPQALEKGLHVAPDLMPVDLPDDISLSEFSPDRMEWDQEDEDDFSDSDLDSEADDFD